MSRSVSISNSLASHQIPATASKKAKTTVRVMLGRSVGFPARKCAECNDHAERTHRPPEPAMKDMRPVMTLRTFEALPDADGRHVVGHQFEATDFSQQDLAGCRFEDCAFIDVRFRSADLNAAEFHGCEFFRPDPVATCDFSFANLREARFVQCDLTTAVFERCRCFGIELDRCNAQGCDFNLADTSLGLSTTNAYASATFTDCNLAYSDFTGVDLSECRLTGCRLIHAIFNEANLTRADLGGSDLSNFEARFVELAGVDLRGATFNNINLREVDLTGAKVTPDQVLMLLEPLGIDVELE